jgi:hypothetical protein
MVIEGCSWSIGDCTGGPWWMGKSSSSGVDVTTTRVSLRELSTIAPGLVLSCVVSSCELRTIAVGLGRAGRTRTEVEVCLGGSPTGI